MNRFLNYQKMRNLTLLSIFACVSLCAQAQVHYYAGTENIDVPFLHIITVDGEIPSSESYTCPPEGAIGACVATNPNKVKSRLVITQLGDTLYDSGEYVKKESGLTVKIRGNSSSQEKIQKKSYKLKLEKKANLIPVTDPLDKTDYRDKEWVLLNNTERNYNELVARTVSKMIGMPWTPRSIPVQMEMNGDYYGFYYLSEAVSKNNDCRLVLGDGGYVVEMDPYWWNEDKWFVGPIYSTGAIRWTYKEPDTDDLTPRWEEVILNQISQLEENIKQPNVASYLDFESTAQWLLSQDVLGNSDAAGSNIYFLGKDTLNPFPITMPLLWDFDGDFKVQPDEHSYSHSKNVIFIDLLANSEFASYYQSFFNENALPLMDGTIAYLDSLVNSPLATSLDSLAYYENLRWFDGIEAQKTVSTLMNKIRTYLVQRRTWMQSLISALPVSPSIVPLNRKYYNLLGVEVTEQTPGIVISNDGQKRINL